MDVMHGRECHDGCFGIDVIHGIVIIVNLGGCYGEEEIH
jgi:hypothetical protein